MTPADRRLVEHRVGDGGVPRFELAEWWDSYRVVAGVTARTEGGDFALGRGQGHAEGPWRRLLASVGEGRLDSLAVSRQVHGAEIAVHAGPRPGIRVEEGSDGHLTTTPGVLLAVTVADCVPIYLLEPSSGTVAILHAGWRGVAAGLLERGVDSLERVSGAPANDMVMHCGVSICGNCYEVGPEVVAAVTGHTVEGPTHLDLRGELLERAARLGLRVATASSWCSAHDRGHFYSHRGSGGREGCRMAAFIGRPAP